MREQCNKEKCSNSDGDADTGDNGNGDIIPETGLAAQCPERNLPNNSREY